MLVSLALLGAFCSHGESVKYDDRLPDDVELPQENTTVAWPGIISIFTKGGGWPGDSPEGHNYLTGVVEAGFGAYLAQPDKLPTLQKFGLKLFTYSDDEGKTARELRDNSNVLGYWMRYPSPTRLWPELGEVEAKMTAADPSHPALYALEATWGQPEYYVEAIKPRAIWYRHYLWEGHHPEDKFQGARWAPMNEFLYLDRVRRTALAAGGLPIIRWVHLADPVKLRYTVSMSLVYGIRGFTWWQGWVFFDLQKQDNRGVPILSPAGEEIARLNQTMKAFAPIFAKAYCVAVYHTWPYPMFPIVAPEEYWAHPASAYLSMGVFRDRAGNTYFVAGNRNMEESQEASIRFTRPIDSVQMMDKKTGQWKPVPVSMEEDADVVTFTLPVASTELLWVKPVSDCYRSPAFDSATRIFVGQTSCRIIAPCEDGNIRYTLDGSIPTQDSQLYANPIIISDTYTVKARFFHEDGTVSRVSAMSLTKVTPAAHEKSLTPGVTCQWYAGNWETLPDFATLQPVGTSIEPQFRIPKSYQGQDGFGLQFDGLIRISKAGVYTFFTASDDGSRLLLADTPIVDNDGVHAAVEKSGEAHLKPGLYPIRVIFMEAIGGESLQVSYSGTEFPKQEIPSSVLFHRSETK